MMYIYIYRYGGIAFRHLSDTSYWINPISSWCRKGIGKVSERILGVPQNCGQSGGTTYRASERHRKESERFYHILNALLINRSTLAHTQPFGILAFGSAVQAVVEHGVDLRPWACDGSS